MVVCASLFPLACTMYLDVGADKGNRQTNSMRELVIVIIWVPLFQYL